MNRREALAALVALPEVARVSVARPQPDDTVVVESNEWLSAEHVARIHATLAEVWPGRRIVVLDKSLRIVFARNGEEPRCS